MIFFFYSPFLCPPLSCSSFDLPGILHRVVYIIWWFRESIVKCCVYLAKRRVTCINIKYQYRGGQKMLLILSEMYFRREKGRETGPGALNNRGPRPSIFFCLVTMFSLHSWWRDAFSGCCSCLGCRFFSFLSSYAVTRSCFLQHLTGLLASSKRRGEKRKKILFVKYKNCAESSGPRLGSYLA